MAKLPKVWVRQRGTLGSLLNEGDTQEVFLGGVSPGARTAGHFRIHLTFASQDPVSFNAWRSQFAWGVYVGPAGSATAQSPNANPDVWVMWGTVMVNRDFILDSDSDPGLRQWSSTREVKEESHGMRSLANGDARLTVTLLDELAFQTPGAHIIYWDAAVLIFQDP